MITLILHTATLGELNAAADWTADQLHIPRSHVIHLLGVAYVCRHFEQGVYSGWDGFMEMRKADQHNIDRYNERKTNKR